MSHYFTNEEIKSEERQIKVKIKNNNYLFYVDNGVFSKTKLDKATKLLLENLELKEIKGDILDFGCGYGPIGIYVAKNTKANIDMIDINKKALQLSEKNAIINKVKVNVFESNIYSNINKKYNYIITNPPIRVGKDILYKIIFGAFDYLKENGQLWFVINKNQGAKTLVKYLEKKYIVTIINKNNGFYVIKVQKSIDNL